MHASVPSFAARRATVASPRCPSTGSILLVALFVMCLSGVFLFSYLTLANSQKRLVTRAQAWNTAIGLAEAGVEEALAHLNPGAFAPPVDRAADGWGGPSGGMYGPLTRTLPSGSYSVVCTADPFPTIYATGYVKIPSLSTTISRTLRVATTNVPLFLTALASSTNINFNGNGTMINSFNSTLTNLSTDGGYDPTKASTNGDVASFAGVVKVGNGNIYGKVLLGPIASDTIGNGQVTGGTFKDFNVNFWDVVLPQLAWMPITPLAKTQTIDGISYDYVIDGSGGPYNCSVSGLSGNLYVGTNTQVNLLVTGTANLNYLRVAGAPGQAGHLSLYMDGGTFTLSTVETANATNFTYFGTTNNTKITFSGSSTFTGTVYAPEAQVNLNGGGSNIGFIGSLVANAVNINGHYEFHYDENLLTCLWKGLSATSWSEL